MDFLGIGPAELVMIVILLLLFLGPRDVVELFRKFGRMVRRLRASPTWNVINTTAQTLRNLPNSLAEEAGMEEIRKDLLKTAETSRSIGQPKGEPPASSDRLEADGDISAWVTPPPGPSVVPPPTNYRIRPAADDTAETNGAAENPAEEDTPNRE
jgi:Sec-independent protein translocase protein TatA